MSGVQITLHVLSPFYFFFVRDLKWAGGANVAGFVDPGQFSPAVRFILVIGYNVTRSLANVTFYPSLVVMATYLIRYVNAMTYFIEYWGCEMIKTMAEQETDEEQAYSPFETRCQDLHEELMGANELMNHAFGIAGTITTLTMILHTGFNYWESTADCEDAACSAVSLFYSAFWGILASVFLVFLSSVGDAYIATMRRFFQPKVLWSLQAKLSIKSQEQPLDLSNILEYLDKWKSMDVGFAVMNVTMTKYKVAYLAVGGVLMWFTVSAAN